MSLVGRCHVMSCDVNDIMWCHVTWCDVMWCHFLRFAVMFDVLQCDAMR